MLYLIDIEAKRISTDSVEILRFANRTFISLPSDTPRNTRWAERLMNGGSFEQTLFQPDRTSGAAQSDWGDLQIENTRYDLSWLLTDGSLSGRPITISYAQDGARDLNEFEPFARLSVSSAKFESAAVSFVVRDALQVMRDTPICTRRFIGNNVPPDGLEGGEDLGGQPFPQVIGAVRNVTLPCVNVSKHIYALSATVKHGLQFGGSIFTGGLADSGIYDKGSPYTRGADYTSISDLLSVQPATGTFRVFPGSMALPAYVRIGSQPDGEVTATMSDGALDHCTSAAVVQRLAGIGGITVSDEALAALAAQRPGYVGFWAASGETVGAALDLILGAGSGYLIQKPNGDYASGILTAPAGVAVAHLTRDELTDPQVRPSEYDGQPVWRVVLNYAPNWTVQTKDSLAGYAEDRELFWRSKANLTVVAEAPEVREQFPLASEITLNCSLTQASAAKVLAEQILALHRDIRFFISASVPDVKAASIAPGALVALTLPQYGLTARPMWVLSRASSLTDSSVEFTFWG